MDAAEALLQPVRVPRQVVVHHQVGALQVDPLACRVGGQEDLHAGIVTERLLRLAALLAAQAAVDHHDRLLAPEHRADAPAQIRQRVAMLGEDDQLLRMSRLRGRGRRAIGGQDLPEQPGELPPLGVRAAAPHSERELLHVPQRPDLGLQLRDRPGGGRLIEDLLGRLLLLVGRRVLQVLELVRRPARCSRDSPMRATA